MPNVSFQYELSSRYPFIGNDLQLLTKTVGSIYAFSISFSSEGGRLSVHVESVVDA